MENKQKHQKLLPIFQIAILRCWKCIADTVDMDEITWQAVMSDGILALSQSSRQGDETKISSGKSRSQRGDDLIEILQ